MQFSPPKQPVGVSLLSAMAEICNRSMCRRISRVNDECVLAGVAHGLDASLEDALHARAGDLHVGLFGQAFVSGCASFFRQAMRTQSERVERH
jgi:hypothetical protein